MLQKVNDHTMLADGSYHLGKKFVQLFIPAASSLYFILGSIWDLPAVEQVIGIFAIIATIIGICLNVSSRQYDVSEAAFDGKVIIETNGTGRKLFSLELGGDPEEIEEKYSVAFKVKSVS